MHLQEHTLDQVVAALVSDLDRMRRQAGFTGVVQRREGIGPSASIVAVYSRENATIIGGELRLELR